MNLKRDWVLPWAAFRLPLFALVAYLFRYQLVGFYESTFGFLGRMDFIVFTISTLSTRLLLYFILILGLGLGFWLVKKLVSLSNTVRYLISLAGAFLVIYISYTYLFQMTDAFARTTAVTALLALNTLPQEWLAKGLASGRWVDLIFMAGVGVVEAFIPQSYILWLMEKGRVGNTARKWAWLSGVTVASLFWIFLFVPYDNPRVFSLAEKIHADPSVEKFATGIYNWVELNPDYDLLYVVGRGTNFMLAFDTNHLEQPPLRSREDIGKTQSFAFNPVLQELYVYKAETRELVYLNALTLETLRYVPVPDLSPGDVWIQWQARDDTIVLSSEADAEIGTPVYVFERESGKIIASMPFPIIPTAYLIFHPEKPLMYFNSFRDPYFAVWDMTDYKITKQVEISPRTDRMVFSAKDNEIWIASPLDGAILRYNADTLEATGRIKASLGDRTLTLDTTRNLLLTGNFMNNRLVVIDLTTNKPISSFYLGPWIRTIALDTEKGLAYVSTVRGMFRVTYTK